MQTITFPGKEAQACRVEVGIAYRQGDAGRRADIVLIHNRRVGHQTSLLVSDQARDIVLNKILANDLQGVRVDCVRLVVLVDLDEPSPLFGMEFPIQLDLRDYMRQGNPYRVESVRPGSFSGWLRRLVGFGEAKYSLWKRDVTGGCARFHTPTDQRRELSHAELDALCAAIGYQREGAERFVPVAAVAPTPPAPPSPPEPQRVIRFAVPGTETMQ